MNMNQGTKDREDLRRPTKANLFTAATKRTKLKEEPTH